MPFVVKTATAPSYWAAYLINDDPSGLECSDISACDAWLKREGFGRPVGCEDAGFMRCHDAANEMPLASDCQTYSFLIQQPRDARGRFSR